ncbi:MAG: hypothetical protein AAGF91_07010 [Actinomycetota bacterium]
MESDADERAVGRRPADELLDVRRATLRPHLEYPAPPGWVWPTLGAAAALYTWSWALDQPAPGLPVMVVALAINFWVVAHITRRRGVFPEFSTMPRPLRREAFRAWALVAVLAAIVIVSWQMVSPVVATIISAVGFPAIMYTHQRRHDAIAREIAADLAEPDPHEP